MLTLKNNKNYAIIISEANYKKVLAGEKFDLPKKLYAEIKEKYAHCFEVIPTIEKVLEEYQNKKLPDTQKKKAVLQSN